MDDDSRSVAFAPSTMPEGDVVEGKILVVDDDWELAEGLVEILRLYGFAAAHAVDWQTTLAMLQAERFDLIILDQHLGRVDTVNRLAEVKVLTDAPVVFLSGNRMEADRIIGLEMGAVDFLLKPISGREIVARARAHLRRLAPAFNTRPPTIRACWRLSVTERRLYRPDGSVLPLTAAEFGLLEHLAQQPGEPTGRDTLTRQVLNRAYRAEDRSIDNLVYQLRQKIGQAGGGEVIVAMRSRGYAFTGFEKAVA